MPEAVASLAAARRDALAKAARDHPPCGDASANPADHLALAASLTDQVDVCKEPACTPSSIATP